MDRSQEPARGEATAPDDPVRVGPPPATGALGAEVAPDELLAPGTVVARFIVHRAVGAGGAGVVYAAHDPELDRTIALKVLRREVADRADARARFLREAQALARLSHPNVISVYDVGSAEGRAFIAMEYIQGRTLADWLAARPRSWQQIVAVMVKAGRGLAAAHATGLTHRDFKPANLLVGDDGRVVVTDFGLARAFEAGEAITQPDPRGEPADRSGAPRSAVAATITRTGAVQGTPRYMAPEQQHGQAADARADQFGFCVTLHEAVFGAHPFLPRPSSPSSRDRRRVPVWLQRAVQRGLAERPDDRHPGMDSLLHALVQAPVRRRRRIQLAAAAAAVVLVGAGVTAYGLSDRRDDALCAGAASRLTGIWNPGTRAEIAAAFAATNLPYALDTWHRVAPILDGYAAQWSAMHTDACLATRVRGEQSELLMDRRMACLDVDRRELDQLTRLLLHPDADVVEHAVQAAHGLGSIRGCGDLAALIRRVAPPSDTLAAAQVSAVRAQLAQVRVLHAAGKYVDGLARVAQLAAEPVVSGYLPLRAEIAYATGQLHASRAEWQLALTSLQDAIWAAEASGHDEIAVAALAGAVSALSDLDRFKEADDMIRRGEAALLRSAAAPLQRAEFRASVCHARDREARFPEARDQCQQVLDLRLGALDSEQTDVAIAMYHLGELANRDEHSDSNEQALRYFRRALAIEEGALGPEHPELQRTLTAMAESELRLGRLDDALAHDRRALVIAERAFGADSMRVFRVLWSLGDVLRRLQRPAEALEVDRRALAVSERVVGPEHSQTALAHLRIGDALQDQTDYAAALQHYQRAEATLAAAVGTSHPNYGIAVLDVCSMQLELKRPRQALPTCTLSLDVLERALGRGAPTVADALVGLIDRVYAANGMMREALAALDRGIASWPKGDPTAPAKLAEGELTLAQTIWEYVPSERARARSLAIRARDRLRDAGPDRAAQRDAAAAWLAAHR